MAEERLQKILARAGIASRRKAEELITSGRVRVEGRIVTELGTKADTRAKIEVDGRRIERDQLCYGVLHKPRHMVTTLSDPEGRPTAQDILRQVGVRVMPVGRLDFNTSGALLFTNDGDFAQGLSHAKNGVPKVYVATIQGVPDERKLARWGESIEIDGKRTRPADVRILRREDDKSWVEVTIREGRNRQVRRLAEHAQSPVVRLARISHAGIDTEGLKPGEWRLLTIDELKELKKAYGVPEKIRGVMEVPPEVRVRPLRTERRPAGERRAPSGERSERGGRSSTGERGERGGRSSTGERGERSFGERSERGGRPSSGERAGRSFGERSERGGRASSSSERTGRPSSGERGGRSSSFGERSERSFGERGERGGRSSTSERTGRGSSSGERSFGERSAPRGAGPRGAGPRGAAPRGAASGGAGPRGAGARGAASGGAGPRGAGARAGDSRATGSRGASGRDDARAGSARAGGARAGAGRGAAAARPETTRGEGRGRPRADREGADVSRPRGSASSRRPRK